MKLSEELERLHESGDYGVALEGMAERAKILEDASLELFATSDIIAKMADQQKEACLRATLTGAKIEGTTIDFT